jgi:hypothetical protein
VLREPAGQLVVVVVVVVVVYASAEIGPGDRLSFYSY